MAEQVKDAKDLEKAGIKTKLNTFLLKHEKRDSATPLILGMVCFATGFTLSAVIWWASSKKGK